MVEVERHRQEKQDAYAAGSDNNPHRIVYGDDRLIGRDNHPQRDSLLDGRTPSIRAYRPYPYVDGIRVSVIVRFGRRVVRPTGLGSRIAR